MTDLDWDSLAVVVFDVDGTLYAQGPLRRRMMAALAAHCLWHPSEARVVRILAQFRRMRERLAIDELDRVGDRQYRLPAERLGLAPDAVRAVVEHWMEVRPLPFLRACRFPAVDRFMDAARSSGKTVAVFSDYPTRAKLEALGLQAEIHICALDPEVDRLKPHPRGLEWLLQLTGAAPEQVLLIGDRADRDGACARRASIQCLLRSAAAVRGYPVFDDYEALLSRLGPSAARIATLE